MRKSITIASALLGMFVLGNAAAAPTAGQATADERAAIRRDQETIAKDYAKIKAQQVVIRAEYADNAKLIKEIGVAKAKLAKQKQELLQDAWCAVKLQTVKATLAKLDQSLANAKNEVKQDEAELALTKDIAQKQEAVCDLKVKDKEDKAEIDNCNKTLKTLKEAVAKEEKDLAQSKARVKSVEAQKVAVTASGAFCAKALKENGGTTNVAAATADERKAIAKLQAQIEGLYKQIDQNRKDIATARDRIAKLLAEITSLRARIAKNRAEALGDALCAIYLQEVEAQLDTLDTRIASLKNEVTQDEGELKATKDIAAAQATLCAKKKADKEDAKEIAACNALLADLKSAVVKEEKDLKQAQANLDAAEKAKTALKAKAKACTVAVKN